jgi:hypothetical protein
VADVALADLDLRLAPELEPLVLRDVAGRGWRAPQSARLSVFYQKSAFCGERRRALAGRQST